jgi:hypothetical protein
VADTPQFLTLKRNRDLDGTTERPWIRWALVAALTVVVGLGAFNVFGQQPESEVADADAARLQLLSPNDLRSGLYFMSRFVIDAKDDLDEATLVLDPGWLEGVTLNTVEPSPVGEASRDGRIAFELGHIPAGDQYRFYLHFQVNPTEFGRRNHDVELYDGDTLLARIDRTTMIWP